MAPKLAAARPETTRNRGVEVSAGIKEVPLCQKSSFHATFSPHPHPVLGLDIRGARLPLSPRAWLRRAERQVWKWSDSRGKPHHFVPALQAIMKYMQTGIGTCTQPIRGKSVVSQPQQQEEVEEHVASAKAVSVNM